MTHICVSKLTIIGSHNGLLAGRRQAIIWTNAGILLIELFGANKVNFIGNSNIFIQENVHENVVCEMASILSRHQCVKQYNSSSQIGGLQHHLSAFLNSNSTMILKCCRVSVWEWKCLMAKYRMQNDMLLYKEVFFCIIQVSCTVWNPQNSTLKG